MKPKTRFASTDSGSYSPQGVRGRVGRTCGSRHISTNSCGSYEGICFEFANDGMPYALLWRCLIIKSLDDTGQWSRMKVCTMFSMDSPGGKCRKHSIISPQAFCALSGLGFWLHCFINCAKISARIGAPPSMPSWKIVTTTKTRMTL